MIGEEMNEADVREEIAAPLLTELGYRRGTENDILREFPLSYDRFFLGRKKKDDPPLRGRCDYVLAVAGAGRWVLEVKAPSVEIGRDEIDQAISYARHPEISATYAAVFNGRRLVVMHQSQRSTDAPVIELEVDSPRELAIRLGPLLGPAAIKRDCSPPIVDLGLPLAPGLRSAATIRGGVIAYSGFQWESNVPMPAAQKDELDELCRKMENFRSNIIGGRVARDNSSRIVAKLNWAVPHDAMLQFIQDKHLLDAEYASLSSTISSDRNEPTLFDVVGSVSVEPGEQVFDLLRWDTQIAGIPLSMNYRGQALGSITENIFAGTFQAEYESRTPLFPAFSLSLFTIGAFEVVLDPS